VVLGYSKSRGAARTIHKGSEVEQEPAAFDAVTVQGPSPSVVGKSGMPEMVPEVASKSMPEGKDVEIDQFSTKPLVPM